MFNIESRSQLPNNNILKTPTTSRYRGKKKNDPLRFQPCPH